MKQDIYKTKFVGKMPDELQEGVLYIAPHFNCALHKCMCGCRETVCTPLDENQWKWIFDGYNASLSPSIGNFQQSCKSHYFMRKGKVIWC